ncbi:helicase-related protein [Methylocystis heyeri]|uniref:Helicase n=1 Tax=Methylocystis heyeri TaxID=391905 RepID=A0A6B8KH59_9HYPH|nr:helicase-related protein [Methylocystis heyeri]QGM47686.1 helicase [Methylocystis heyeri]
MGELLGEQAARIRPYPGRADARLAGVCALLGPTNTGKTHHAIERMLSFPSGMIGLPLRLLAREVYNRVVQRIGADNVALVTGEEKIKPRAPRYWIATVEAMPRDVDVDFIAIDEVQLAADLDRGHVFTDRLLRWRGRQETLLIGASTMAPLIEAFMPGAPIFSRPRLSRLSYAGHRKISRLPPRSAIVAFSAEEVYAIAEWIKRQKGGAAVVIGALSPRTRNAQVDLYQNGDVDYLVATDAIGMGLNLDVDHIAFASDRKFDGWRFRRLTSAELGQIAGRAGRHMNDGTFGGAGRCPPFDEDLIEALEDHRFDPVTTLQWRNPDLDFSTPRDLAASLDVSPDDPCLVRAPVQEDQLALEALMRDEDVRRNARAPADVARLWEACQIPDYRKSSPAAHAELAGSIFGFIVRRGRIPEDWMARQLAVMDRVDGDISTLANRLAQVRTWSFVANRSGWLENSSHWQSVARQVEDRISDALHERLTQRFVDRRTSVLMRRLRENAMLEAEITASGDVVVEGQHVGSLQGFRFTADPAAAGEAAKALNAAAQKALAGEFDARATRVFDAVDDAFVLGNDGTIRWLGEPVGKIAEGPGVLKPTVHVLADEQLTGAVLDKVKQRLELWLAQRVKKLLGPLEQLEAGEGLTGAPRGVAFQIAEELGVLERSRVAKEVKNFTQEERAALRKLGVRFGAYHLYLPLLLKPAPRSLAALLWALRHGGLDSAKGLEEAPHLAASGRTSFAADPSISKGFYRAAGYRVCGERVVRVDILERLADLIRPAVSYRPGTSVGEPPAGSADADGFVVTVAMTSLTGCAGEAFASILRSLGYVSTQRPGPAITVPIIPAAATEPVSQTPTGEEPEAAAPAPESAETASAESPAELAPAEPVAAEAAPPAEIVEPAVAPLEIVEAPAVEASQPAAEEAAAPADEAAVSEASSGETAAADAAPQTIEVWTMQRHPAVAPRRQEGGHRRPRPENAGAARPPRRDHAQGERKEETAAARSQESRPRPEGQKGGSRGGGQAAQGPRSGARGEYRGNRDNRDEGRRGRPGGSFSAPEKRERQPDPDSPFAKLLALKAELEKKGKN